MELQSRKLRKARAQLKIDTFRIINLHIYIIYILNQDNNMYLFVYFLVCGGAMVHTVPTIIRYCKKSN